MLIQDKASFAKLMGALGEIYNKQVSPALIALYFECLKDLEFGVIQKNITRLLNTKQFNVFPTPAEIRNPPCDTTEIETEAQLKWLEVISADYDYSHDFGGTTNAVINQVFGGFVKFQNRLNDPRELKAVIKKEFIIYWKLFREQGITAPCVRGFFEKTNTEKGFTEHEKYGYLPGWLIARRNRMLMKLGEKPKAPEIPELSEKEIRENIKRLAQLFKKLEKEKNDKVRKGGSESYSLPFGLVKEI